MPLIWKVPEASGMVKAGNWELIYGFGPIQGVDNTKLSMEVLGLVLIRTRPLISITISSLDNNEL